MISENKKITMRDGIEIHARIKEVGSPIWLIVTHGIGEHLERHDYMAELFGQNFNIFQYDLRGHGRSGGERVWVDDFDHFRLDLDEVLKYLQKEYRLNQYVLFGHSMGGLITASYIQNIESEALPPERVFLCAPAGGFTGPLGPIIHGTPSSFWKKVAAMDASVKLGGLVDLKYLSHDVRVKDAYVSDKFNELKLHSKLLFSMVSSSKIVFSRPLRPPCPAFCAFGAEDRIVNPKKLEEYFTLVEKNFQVKIIEGAYHELHNEVEKYRAPYFAFLKQSIMDCLKEA